MYHFKSAENWYMIPSIGLNHLTQNYPMFDESSNSIFTKTKVYWWKNYSFFSTHMYYMPYTRLTMNRGTLCVFSFWESASNSVVRTTRFLIMEKKKKKKTATSLCDHEWISRETDGLNALAGREFEFRES